MRIGGVNNMKKYKIAVAGTGYVGLSIATLLSQHHHETAVDIIPEKVEMINNRKSPIQDDYIEKYLAKKELNLTARLHVCAKSELGTDVLCDMKPVLITENIEPKRDRGRTHFISFLYQCVPVDKVQLRLLDNQEIKGHLGWFNHIPEHFLPVQDFYRETITKILEQGD